MRAHLHPLAFLAGLAACALSGLSTAAIAQPAPSGPLFRIDPDAPLYYLDLAVDAGPGGFAVAWVEDSPDAEGNGSLTVRARRFDAAGGRLGPPVSLAKSQDFGMEVDVAVGRSGEALVAWIDGGLHGRRLDSAGRPLGKPWLLDADLQLSSPQVVAHPEGGFLMAWQRGPDVVVRRVFANGFLGPKILLPLAGRDCAFQGFDLAVGRRGDVALLCPARTTVLQLLDPSLKPRGRAVPVPMPAPWTPAGELRVAFVADDELSVVWGAYDPDGNRLAIFAERYDLKRGWIGSSLEVDQGDGINAAVAADPAGGLLAIWATLSAMRGRRIEPSGRLGPSFPLDPDGLDEKTGNLSAAAALEAGSFVAVWESRYGLLGQRFVSGSPGQIELRRDRSVAPEAEGQALLEVVRREGSRGEVRASWSVLSQDAVPGEDFEEISGTVTFADGDALPKRIAIPLRDDDRPEGDESFQVVLQDPEGGATLGRRAARVEIRDDDTPSPLLAGAGPAIQVGGIEPVENFGFSCCLDLVRLSTGGLAAAWQLGFESPNVEFAVFDASGQPAGGGHASGAPGQRAPQLLPQPGGGFILISRSNYEFGPVALGWFAQRFDAGGEPLSQQVPLESFRSMERLLIAPAPGGGFFALGNRREVTRVDLFVERYGADCRRIGEPVQVNERPLFDSSTLLEYYQLDIAASPSGALLVVWPRIPSLGRPGGVFARLVSASGAPLGNEIMVAGAAYVVRRLNVAAAPDGGFVVTWESSRDGDGWGISARWLDASGRFISGEMTVNSSTAGSQTRPSAAFDPDGQLLVVWRSKNELRGQLFAGPGRREGSEFTIESTPGRIQLDSTVVAMGPGDWRVFWHWLSDDVSQEGFYIRRLAR